mmetsp:Transcript_25659/g.64711  ORF Transcript_25659/g.64711 Transcript_25659/m.64711 type:complete len:424 (-) Transcript_25659:99-1370(-)
MTPELGVGSGSGEASSSALPAQLPAVAAAQRHSSSAAVITPRVSVLATARRLLSVLLLAVVCLPPSAQAVVLRGRHTNSTGFAANGSNPLQARPPRVYFLFLAVDKVSNLDVWQAFFSSAPAHQYRAYVHCKLPSCAQMVQGSPLMVVPTVPSYYCTDLVSPMNQLIATALQDTDGSPNQLDKFAFVSDSTLPAKPFAYVYSTLSQREGSDFCVFPSNEWADVPSSSGQGVEMAVKFHQWITLERAHAEKAWNLWSSGTLHNFMAYFRMNSQQYQWNNNSFADNRNFGCLDEFWHMVALYGTLHHSDPTHSQDVQLAMFSGSPLRIDAGAGWQGQCDTFVLWSKYLHTLGENPFNALHASLDQPSVPHGGNWARPGWWDTLSTHGIRAIRHSSFLFVRKFIDKPHLYDGPTFADAYSSIVLAA